MCSNTVGTLLPAMKFTGEHFKNTNANVPLNNQYPDVGVVP
jgi:hypothetical protein